MVAAMGVIYQMVILLSIPNGVYFLRLLRQKKPPRWAVVGMGSGRSVGVAEVHLYGVAEARVNGINVALEVARGA